ncbi:hypothetical protein N9947_02640 [bacterium]|nr:hypothetical protein [bacterium]
MIDTAPPEKLRGLGMVTLRVISVIFFSLLSHERLRGQKVESWTSVKGQVLEGKGLSWTAEGINIERASDGKLLFVPFSKLRAEDVINGVNSLPFYVNDNVRLRARTSSITSKKLERDTGRRRIDVDLYSYDGYTFQGSGRISPIKEKYRISGRTVEIDLSSISGDGYAGIEFFGVKGSGKTRKIFHSEAGVRDFRGTGSEHYFSFEPVEGLQGWVVVVRSPNTGKIIQVGSSMQPLEKFVTSQLPEVAKIKMNNNPIKGQIIKIAKTRLK